MSETHPIAPGARTPPDGLVARFGQRFGLTAEEIAARLRVPAATLTDGQGDAVPMWLRFALMGLGVELGADRASLEWLLTAGRPAA